MPAPRAMAAEFPPASEADWQQLAGRGKADDLAKLRTRSMDGVPVGPIHTAGCGPVLAMRPAGAPWTVIQRLDRGSANDLRKHAEIATAGGATGVEIVYNTGAAAYSRGIDDKTDLAGLRDVSEVLLRVDAGPDTPRIIEGLGRPDVHAAYDPLSTLAASGAADTLEQSYAGIARLIADGRAAAAFAADGRLWHNGGATEVQELGIALASAVANLRLLAEHGCGTQDAAGRFGVTLAADADQFLTMAKFRAVRLLLARLGEVTGLAIKAPVHAETSWRMLGAREPTMNLVRATTATFAAATGGADSITVLSPLLDDEAFSARMARNVQTILLEESSLYRTADPGAGSGAIEDLTNRLAAAAWALFTRIEGEGGLLAAIRSGTITATVAAARDARLAAVARRQVPMVGINVNVDAGAPLPVASAPAARDGAALTATRLATPIETLAARIDGQPIGLIKAGAGADPGIGDALTALGFTVTQLPAPEAAGDAPPRIAGILVGDAAEDEVRAMAESLRSAGARFVVAFTGSDETAGEGFDAVAAPGDDLVALFSGVLDRIADRRENGQV